MKFTVEYLEVFLLVMVRISAMVYIMPFFGDRSIPVKVKIAISFFLAVLVGNTVDYNAVSYTGVIGYSILVVKEAITGLLIGMAASLSLYILDFSGHMLSLELGLSMATEFDPTSNMQSTVISNFLKYSFMLMFLVTDMHYYLIDALYGSFETIPIGGMVPNGGVVSSMVKYITDYFVIGFRIILPVFSCILVINVVLGILARIAPQMNMFVIGMQLKIFVGLVVIYFVLNLLPGLCDFIFQEMQDMTQLFIKSITP